jgi:hypothetical protein
VTTQAQIDQTRALMEQQDAARQAAVVAAVALALRETEDFDGWYSTSAITAWALGLSRGIEAIQRNLARQLDALMARQATVMTGRLVRPVGAVDPSTLRTGITHPGVYGRIADQYRYQQSLIDADDVLDDLQDAIEVALARAEEIAEMDTALVVRAQAQRVLERQPAAPEGRRLIGYRRMIHPELSTTGQSCGMCIVQTTRIYNKAELMPIHFRCNCLPMAVYENSDPGAVINEQDLEDFYGPVASTDGWELKKTRYEVREHGELGPLLNRWGGAWRGPGENARDNWRNKRR